MITYYKENHKFKTQLNLDLSKQKTILEYQLQSYGITKYTINDDGTVDVNGNVDLSFDLSYRGLTKIPFKFGIVGSWFICNNNNLISLQGAPTTVKGDFYCSYNNLTSLQGAPTTVEGDFTCNNNNLTSLQGAPTTVKGDFYCSDNNLTSLQGAPTTVGGIFYCSYNNLISLEGIPTTVKGNFSCSYNPKLLETYGSKEGIIKFIKANCEVDGEIIV